MLETCSHFMMNALLLTIQVFKSALKLRHSAIVRTMTDTMFLIMRVSFH